MVSVRVSWSRKLRFFQRSKETEDDLNCYIDLFKTYLLPECHRLYLGNDFEFLQDGAQPHRAKVTQQFLRQNTPDFIAADKWHRTSCSPDLNL